MDTRAMAAAIPTIRRSDTVTSAVAISFDDGPDSDKTPAKLGILKEYGARATFFAVGRLVDASPDLIGAIAAAGCETANHSYSHPFLTHLGQEGIWSEIDRTRQALLRAGAGFVPFFRSPYGDFDNRVLQGAADDGYLYHILWDVDPRDWERPSPGAIIDRVLGAATPGSIILMHDWVPETVQALPAILEGLGGQGLAVVSVSGLLGAAAGGGSGTPPSPPAGRPCRTLQVQSPYLRGNDVGAVQQALADRGHDPGGVDAVFGPRTSAAVRRMQSAEGLPVTGVVGPEEYRHLGIECRG